jgi:hypothetical protein
VKKSITITAAPPVVIAPPPKLSKEEEFPSLASASKVNSSKKAAAAVKAPTGTPINFAEAAKKNKDSAVQQKIKNTRSAIQGGYSYHDMKKLTQHVYIPWLDTGSSLNSIYMKEVAYKKPYILIIVKLQKKKKAEANCILPHPNPNRENKPLNMVCFVTVSSARPPNTT